MTERSPKDNGSLNSEQELERKKEEFVEKWYWSVGTEKDWGPDTEEMKADLEDIIRLAREKGK